MWKTKSSFFQNLSRKCWKQRVEASIRLLNAIACEKFVSQTNLFPELAHKHQITSIRVLWPKGKEHVVSSFAAIPQSFRTTTQNVWTLANFLFLALSPVCKFRKTGTKDSFFHGQCENNVMKPHESSFKNKHTFHKRESIHGVFFFFWKWLLRASRFPQIFKSSQLFLSSK